MHAPLDYVDFPRLFGLVLIASAFLGRSRLARFDQRMLAAIKPNGPPEGANLIAGGGLLVGLIAGVILRPAVPILGQPPIWTLGLCGGGSIIGVIVARLIEASK